MSSRRYARNLICPHCGSPLRCDSARAVCANGHAFDLSRRGYVNLLPAHLTRSNSPGDTRAALQHRSRFLSGGYFDRLSDLLVMKSRGLLAQTKRNHPISLLDAGCGEGHLTTRWVSELGGGAEVDAIGSDISKWAIDLAARRSSAIDWIVASNRELPIADDSLDLITCVFGFPHLDCFRRVLAPGGWLLLVESASDHLVELRSLIYDDVETKEPGIEAKHGFTLIDRDSLRYETTVQGDHVWDLLAMTPHFYRASESAKARVEQTRELTLTVSVRLSIYEATP